jgi:hypothetical protein
MPRRRRVRCNAHMRDSRVRAPCRVLHWDARRHRRNLWPHQDPADPDASHLDGRNPFHVTTSRRDADAAARARLHRVSFWVGPTYMVGSVLFVVGAVAGQSPGYWTRTWTPGRIDSWVNIPYLVRRARPAACALAAGPVPFFTIEWQTERDSKHGPKPDFLTVSMCESNIRKVVQDAKRSELG